MVFWHYKLGKSNSEIAILASCSEHTICDILQLHCTYSTVCNPFAQPHGGRCSLTTGDLTYMSSLLAANPCLYLDEFQDQLATDRDTLVSIATISWAVQSLVFSCKHMLKAALERNELLCKTWQAEYRDIPVDYFVSLWGKYMVIFTIKMAAVINHHPSCILSLSSIRIRSPLKKHGDFSPS
jgi:hypothetical protein